MCNKTEARLSVQQDRGKTTCLCLVAHFVTFDFFLLNAYSLWFVSHVWHPHFPLNGIKSSLNEAATRHTS